MPCCPRGRGQRTSQPALRRLGLGPLHLQPTQTCTAAIRLHFIQSKRSFPVLLRCPDLGLSTVMKTFLSSCSWGPPCAGQHPEDTPTSPQSSVPLLVRARSVFGVSALMGYDRGLTYFPQDAQDTLPNAGISLRCSHSFR